MSREELSKSEKYIIETFVKEDDDLKKVRDQLVKSQAYGINVSPSEGQFLQFLVGLIRPQIIVEVGVLFGYSTQWMAKALPEGGKIIAIEANLQNFNMATNLAKGTAIENKIQFIHGDGRSVLSELNVSPDMVFVDADKANYRHYLDWAMEHVRVGGVIVGDNTFLFGNLIGEDRGESAKPNAIESMQYFNSTLAQAPNFRAIQIPTYEGMTLAQKLY